MKSVGTLKTTNLKEKETDNLSPIEESLLVLDKFTKWISFVSTLISITTALNLLFSFLIFFKVNSSLSIQTDRYDNKPLGTLLIILIFFSFMSFLALLYLYDDRRKRGEVLFEEISDELEWYVSNDKDNVNLKRPQIGARIALRSFTKTTDLPFVSGKIGILFYLTLNITLVVISIFYVTKLL